MKSGILSSSQPQLIMWCNGQNLREPYRGSRVPTIHVVCEIYVILRREFWQILY